MRPSAVIENPVTSPRSLMAWAPEWAPPSVPRSRIVRVSGSQRNAWCSPSTVVDCPTISPVALIPSAVDPTSSAVDSPARVPRSSTCPVAVSQRVARHWTGSVQSNDPDHPTTTPESLIALAVESPDIVPAAPSPCTPPVAGSQRNASNLGSPGTEPAVVEVPTTCPEALTSSAHAVSPPSVASSTTS